MLTYIVENLSLHSVDCSQRNKKNSDTIWLLPNLLPDSSQISQSSRNSWSSGNSWNSGNSLKIVKDEKIDLDKQGYHEYDSYLRVIQKQKI